MLFVLTGERPTGSAVAKELPATTAAITQMLRRFIFDPFCRMSFAPIGVKAALKKEGPSRVLKSYDYEGRNEIQNFTVGVDAVVSLEYFFVRPRRTKTYFFTDCAK